MSFKNLRFTLIAALGSVLALASGCGTATTTTSSSRTPAPVLAWGDQGDGTYRNPILKADYSDPDVIRVGDDFYLTGSDFHFVGMQVLHSRDLVNWDIIGQVFDRLTMNPRYDNLQGYAQGTWAPSLREHNGEYYIYVCTPMDGLFMWHAKNPAGPWSDTVTVVATNGWEDPCPFWDDDGQGYLVHSRTGAGPLILHKLSADGTKLLDDGQQIYRGNVAEGPKMFKRHGFYYISLPEGGVDTGGQVMLRSTNIYGPYDHRQVLQNGNPHQGGLVELKNGDGWFIAFKSTGFLGRVDHLIPVHWGDDDWPEFGDNGKTVDQFKKPNVGAVYPVARPQASDEFTGRTLSPQWQWNHNPSNANWSLTERPGWLRLKAIPPSSNSFGGRAGGGFGRGFGGAANPITMAHNTLTQKIWDDTGIADVKLDAGKMADGQHAGFAFMSGRAFGWVGVQQTNGIRRIAWGGGEGPEVPASGNVWLRGTYESNNAHLFYSTDGKSFTDTGTAVTLRFDQWKGARIAIYSYGDGGIADFDYVHYTYGKPAEKVGK